MLLTYVLASSVLALASTELVYFEEPNGPATSSPVTNSPLRDNILPQNKLILNLKRENGPDIQLNLEENKAMDINAPVYDAVYENGKYTAVRRESPNIQGLKHYYDIDKKVSLQVSCVNGRRCVREITGMLTIDGETYEVKPHSNKLFRRSNKRNEHPHQLSKVRMDDRPLADIAEDEIYDFKARSARNVEIKRGEHKTYTVELVVAIHPPIWKMFAERVKNKYGVAEDRHVEKELRRYYSLLVHMASMAYEGMKQPDFTMKIVVSGFLFFKTITEKLSEAYTPEGVKKDLHFGEFLSAIYKDMRESKTLVADHVYTFTTQYFRGTGVAGANCLGCICETRSWGWSISHGQEAVYDTATFAHEIGHGLGLYHSETNRYPGMICNPADGDLMGYTVAGRYWHFTDCSIKEIRGFLSGTDKQECLLNTPNIYDTAEWNSLTNKLPGEIRNITEQCIDRNNGKLYLQGEPLSNLCSDITESDFCQNAKCAKESGGCLGGIRVTSGTSCGLPSLEKWCKAGLCVPKSGTEVKPETTGDAEKCYKKYAETYLGTLSKTKSGYDCQRWDSNEPNSHSYGKPEKFLDKTVADAANYCRDPSGKGKPWCLFKPPQNWEYCDVPTCSAEIEEKCAKENLEYQKTLTKTKSGLTCQRWDSQSPHTHRYSNDGYFSGETIAEAGNYCRNLDSEVAWCFTTDPNKRWDYCEIKKCKNDSCFSKSVEYIGGINLTKTGIPCHNWSSSKGIPGNPCRLLGEQTPWCYLERYWDYCDIPEC